MLLAHYLRQLAQRWSIRGGKRCRADRVPARIRSRVRPRLEVLEDRLTPSGYSVTDVGSPPNGFNIMSSVPSNVNNSGQFADIGYNAQYQYHVLLYSKGQWTDLGQPNSDFNETSLYINNSGQIAASSLVNNQEHPFLYSNG